MPKLKGILPKGDTFEKKTFSGTESRFLLEFSLEIFLTNAEAETFIF